MNNWTYNLKLQHSWVIMVEMSFKKCFYHVYTIKSYKQWTDTVGIKSLKILLKLFDTQQISISKNQVKILNLKINKPVERAGMQNQSSQSGQCMGHPCLLWTCDSVYQASTTEGDGEGWSRHLWQWHVQAENPGDQTQLQGRWWAHHTTMSGDYLHW